MAKLKFRLLRRGRTYHGNALPRAVVTETDYQDAMAARAAANVGRIKPLEGCQLLRYESQDYLSVW